MGGESPAQRFDLWKDRREQHATGGYAVVSSEAPARAALGSKAAADEEGFPCCQVLNCTEKLMKSYCVKKKACTAHMQAAAVQLSEDDPTVYRFCQQCGRFECLDKFDDTKRSCRARLAKRRSGTRAQLLKKGCTSAAPAATAEAAGAVKAAFAAEAAASELLPEINSQWEDQQGICTRSQSVQLPVLHVSAAAAAPTLIVQCGESSTSTGSATNQQQQQQQQTRSTATGAEVTAASGLQATLSINSSVAAAAAAAAAAAVTSASLLRFPSYSDLASCGAADAQLLAAADGGMADVPITEEELIAALQQELEDDGLLISQRPTVTPAAAAVTVQHSVGSSGGDAALLPPPPPLNLHAGSFANAAAAHDGGAFAAAAAAAAAAASGTAPAGMQSGSTAGAAGPRIVDCFNSLSNLRMESACNPLVNNNSSIFAQQRGVAAAPIGAINAAAAAAAQNEQQQGPYSGTEGPVRRQSSGASSRLQWLVQQVQLELQNCSTEDLDNLNGSELRTLFHAALAPGDDERETLPVGSDAAAAAAAAEAEAAAAVAATGSAAVARPPATPSATTLPPAAAAGSWQGAGGSFSGMSMLEQPSGTVRVTSNSSCTSSSSMTMNLAAAGSGGWGMQQQQQAIFMQMHLQQQQQQQQQQQLLMQMQQQRSMHGGFGFNSAGAASQQQQLLMLQQLQAIRDEASRVPGS